MNDLNDIKEYKTASGQTRYKFTIYVGKDASKAQSIQIRKQGFKTLEDAIKCYLDIKDKVKHGEYKQEKHYKYKEVYELWLQSYKDTVKPSTVRNTKQFFKNHIIKDMGNYYIDKITTAICQKLTLQWFSELPKSYKYIFIRASSVMNYAVNIDLITTNPFKKVMKPKKVEITKPFDNFYSKEELKTFLNECKKKRDKRVHTFFRLLAYTGMRKGEALALKWDDIDFKNRAISIQRTQSIGEKNKLIIGSPKTKNSYRTIEIDEVTLNYLQEWRIEQRQQLFKLGYNALSDSQLVFSNSNNEMLRPWLVQRWNITIGKHAGLKHISVHGFRHTHASLLFEAGTPMQDVKERLGHASITTTMNVYTHVTSSHKKQTADNFAKFMEG